MAEPVLVVPFESASEIYSRLLEDLPPPAGGGEWNTRAGSVIHAILQPVVVEIQRQGSYVSDIFASSFLLYATGRALEDKAAEFGVARQAAVKANVNLLVTAPEGTPVPQGSRFATAGDPVVGSPGLEFETLDAAAVGAGETTVTVRARSLEGGSRFNVEPGAITFIVSTLPNVTAVTNELPAVNGEDEQDDESLRSVALQRAGSIPNGGNKATYVAYALDDTSIEAASVEDLWQGNGTAALTLSDAVTGYVDPLVVDDLQNFLDPTIRMLAHIDGETWTGTGVTTNVAYPFEGRVGLDLTNTLPALEVTAVYAYPTPLDLGFWHTTGDEVWLYINRLSGGATLDATAALRIRLIDPAGAATGLATTTVTAATINALGGSTGKGLLKIPRSSFTSTGTLNPDWNAVGSIELIMKAAAASTAQLVIDSLRIRAAAGGSGEGIAPIGIQVTVRSASQIQVDVTATVYTTPDVALADISDGIKAAIKNAIEALPQGSTVLTLSRVANAIYDYPGVEDYTLVKIARAGGAPVAANLTLAENERPTTGTVTLTAG